MAQHETLLVVAAREVPEFRRLSELPHRMSNDVATLPQNLEEVTAILHWSGSREVVRQALLRAPSLRWVHSKSAGLDGRLFPELIASDVILTNGKGVFSASLGEFALAAILYFAKGIPRMRRNQAARKWVPFDLERIEKQTVGIVGYGDIGCAVAERARAMGMKIVATKRLPPTKPDPIVDRYFPIAELHAMLAICDYIVVATPLTPETRHMFGAAEFAAMKPSAVFINLGRGAVVDEGALLNALQGKQLKGAALDVFEHEPLPSSHPFYGMDEVLLSPHCADNVHNWEDDAMIFFLEQYARFNNGQPLLNVVNKQLGY